MNRFATIAAGLAMVMASNAQTSNDMLAQLSTEDMESLKSLVMYPGETRAEILEAATQPSALIKMEKIKDRTSTAFNDMIEGKSTSTQQALWDLTRYPGLVDALVAAGPGKTTKLDAALTDFDPVIHARAKEMHGSEFNTLEGISRLNRESEAAFEGVMTAYPQTTQKALRGLLDHPEVLSILTEKMDLTVTVGDMYRRDPKGTLQMADSLNQVVEAENAEELAAWKERLENDPKAREEFKKSTEEFEKAQVPDDVYYDSKESEKQRSANGSDVVEERVVEHHYYHNYPYWFSYPRWYSYPRWRPYPWWYDWGFYYGWGGGWGVGWGFWGMPSFYYMNWYFGNPWHHYNYPGLTCQYMNHYYGHRNSLGSISVSAETWHRDNAAVLPDDLSSRNPQQQEAIREFGKLEADRQTYNRANPDRPLDQTTYLRANSDRFNTLAEQAGRERPTTSEAGRFERPAALEKPSRQTTDRPAVEKRPSNTNERPVDKAPSNDRPVARPTERQPTQQGTTRPQSKERSPSMDRAVDMHRSGWNKSNRGSWNNGGSRTSPTPSKSPSNVSPSGGGNRAAPNRRR